MWFLPIYHNLPWLTETIWSCWSLLTSITFIASLPTLEIPPCSLARRYEARLARQNILAGQRPHSHQWLRRYLDCCHKYSFSTDTLYIPLSSQNHCI